MENNTKSVRKYELVSQKILKMAIANHQHAGDRLPSERKLQAELGVSRSTVQHALKKLSEQGQIKSSIGSGNYWQIDPFQSDSKHYIPLLITINDSSPFFTEIISGVKQFFKENNMFTSIYITDFNQDQEKNLINDLVRQGYNVIVVYSNEIYDLSSFYREHMRNGIQFIFIDHIYCGISGDLICSDNINGSFLTTEHLIKKGHKHIAFGLSYNFSHNMVSSISDRYYGYRSALEQYGIPFNQDYIIDFTFPADDYSNIKIQLEKLFETENPPTAFFAVNNYFASIFSEVIMQIPSAPKNIEIIGFDRYNIDFYNNFPCAVLQPFYDMGYAAAELAFRRLNGERGAYITKTLPIKFGVK